MQFEIEPSLQPFIEPLGRMTIWAARVEGRLREMLALATVEATVLQAYADSYAALTGETDSSPFDETPFDRFDEHRSLCERQYLSRFSLTEVEKFIQLAGGLPVGREPQNLSSVLQQCKDLKERRNRFIHDRLELTLEIGPPSTSGNLSLRWHPSRVGIELKGKSAPGSKRHTTREKVSVKDVEDIANGFSNLAFELIELTREISKIRSVDPDIFIL